jgi:hypothetical protein
LLAAARRGAPCIFSQSENDAVSLPPRLARPRALCSVWLMMHRPATGAVGFGPGHKRGEEGNEQNEKKPLHPAFIAIPAQFRDARHNAEPG